MSVFDIAIIYRLYYNIHILPNIMSNYVAVVMHAVIKYATEC